MKKRGIPTNLLLAICYKIAYLKLNYNYDTGLTKKSNGDDWDMLVFNSSYQ